MNIKDTFWRLCQWAKPRRLNQHTTEPIPLREFVYLDEVSLRSLLASQTGAVTDQISEAISKAEQAELSAGVGAGTVIGKADFRSRFQTTNSSNLQTSRKVIVQSLFKEFREMSAGRLLFKPATDVRAVDSVDAIALSNDSSQVTRASELTRGSLLEIEVELKVDPVFQLGTMISEFAGMVKESPKVFAEYGLQKSLAEAVPVNNILQRLLAGLIPIRCRALNYLVVELNGERYVVHRDAIANLNIKTSPLIIVGVTEHSGYWKDIRRILFSEGEFTLLCRIGRTGVHKEWTPVKLADLFREVAPGLTDQINAAGKMGLSASGSAALPDMQQVAMRKALEHYAELYTKKVERSLPSDYSVRLNELTQQLARFGGTVGEQKNAFATLANSLAEVTGTERPNPDEDLSMRRESREIAGLKIIPTAEFAISQAPVSLQDTGEGMDKADDAFIDVEVIAIYW